MNLNLLSSTSLSFYIKAILYTGVILVLHYLNYVDAILVCNLAALAFHYIYKSDSRYWIIWRSSLIGAVTAFGLVGLVTFDIKWKPLALFLISLSCFHFSEFFVLSIVNSRSVDSESFLLDHSIEYLIANIITIIEFILETILMPNLKWHPFIMFIGASAVLIGETIRKSAMFTARSNFDHHIIANQKREQSLVTHGLYSFCRHPSYLGWYLWAVGNQLMLFNPISLILAVRISWQFFASRIYNEEKILKQTFGDHYSRYQLKVKFTGIPFVKGHLDNSPRS